MEFDELVRDATGSGTNDRPYILEFSAGNAGPGAETIDSPAAAKNVIATGACENDRPDFLIYADGSDAMADFSSRGPCEDGRIKPDVVAPGTWVSSLQSESATDQYAWLPIDSLYQYQGGTSQAGPHASGAAAVFVQYYRDTHTNATPSPAMVKAALINSADQMDTSFGTGPIPNMDEGWGRIDIANFFDTTLTFEFFDQPVMLTNGQVFEKRVLVASQTEPLKITMAYTDVPGFPGAIPALVNDLDLEVVAPDGRLYRGNQFNGAESVPDAPTPDSVNNVEGVYLGTPVPGEYIVRVRARNVVEDVLGASGAPRQDFALVICGLLPVPGVGVIFLDRSSYTAPSQIHITVIDTDQAGHATETVHASSLREPLGEAVVLTAAGSSGSFTGQIATATGPPISDGRLQITNNDTISVTYYDASLGVTRVATARGDLMPPVLGTPSATGSYGQETIAWSSDEPSTSIVRYGTNASLAGLTLAVTNTDLTTNHLLVLGSLVASRTYYYAVISADEAGNVATNCNGGNLFSFVAPVTAPVLVIDEYSDPYGFGIPPLSGYTDPLDSLGVSYDVWDVSTLGNFTTNVLHSYRVAFWRVPDFDNPGTAAERQALTNYVYGGGALFLASMEMLSRLTEVNDTGFIENFLQVQSFITDEDPNATFAAEIIGSPNETVGNGIDIVMDYSVYEDLWLWQGLIGPDISDNITPASSAAMVLRNDYGSGVGLRWPAVGQKAPGRLVFCSFPLDAVPMGAGVDDRINLVKNILAFLAPGVSGVASLSLDSSAYNVPSLVNVEVGDGKRAGQGSVSVSASSTTQTNAVMVTLLETSNPGDFVGSFTVVRTNTALAANRVRAKNGDTLRINYTNAAAGIRLSATAAVDTTPPIITEVAAAPDYQAATISWSTSEPADSLVQFGESPLLGRTAYDPGFNTSHSVDISGLDSDRIYYFQVVSADVAGNTTTDDNLGNLYTLRTLRPLFAPWSDTMDTGATNWSVYSDPSSEVGWTLGTPNNSQETSAHSPPDAWCSNLDGNSISGASTFLIGPALQLPGGATAKLQFWHSYDFYVNPDVFDIYEYGDVLLITNDNSTTPITLAEYSDDTTPGWIQETNLDLTPYAGQIVYLVWDYELFSFDTRARAGWMVDDVSIVISYPPVGTVVVSNNLWQASSILTGPISRTNNGIYTVISNAPVGQYVITFRPVPYYFTPAPQTNSLSVSNTIVFSSKYNFPDVNTNGISDLWEQYFFGAISTNRTQKTDSNGDGFSDYQAFMAGTDPNKAPPPIPVSVSRLSNSMCRLKWPSYPAQHYLVLSSSNLLAWKAYSTNWLSTNQFDIPVLAASPRAFFRIQTASTLPQDLRLSIKRLTPYRMKLTWESSPGRGYCVFGSSNMVTWSSVSGWFQATANVASWALPAITPGHPQFYRVQVSP